MSGFGHARVLIPMSALLCPKYEEKKGLADYSRLIIDEFTKFYDNLL